MSFLADEYGVEIKDRFDTVRNYIDWYDDTHTSVVIRKGAISARKGERIVIPLNMRDGIIIAHGRGNEEWNCSAPHGSGRAYSRSDARRTFTLRSMPKKWTESTHGLSVKVPLMNALWHTSRPK